MLFPGEVVPIRVRYVSHFGVLTRLMGTGILSFLCFFFWLVWWLFCVCCIVGLLLVCVLFSLFCCVGLIPSHQGLLFSHKSCEISRSDSSDSGH